MKLNCINFQPLSFYYYELGIVLGYHDDLWNWEIDLTEEDVWLSDDENVAFEVRDANVLPI